MELIEKLCALIPPPRFHLLRFHGVLAPRARLRAAVVPLSRRDAEGGGDHGLSPERPEPGSGASPQGGRLSGAALLKRVFALDLLRCSRCGGCRRLVAVYPGGRGCAFSWTGSSSVRLQASRRRRGSPRF